VRHWLFGGIQRLWTCESGRALRQPLNGDPFRTKRQICRPNSGIPRRSIMFKPPVVRLPSGVYLYYTDSGESSVLGFDTIVIVHGVVRSTSKTSGVPVLTVEFFSLNTQGCSSREYPDHCAQSTGIQRFNTIVEGRKWSLWRPSKVGCHVCYLTNRISWTCIASEFSLPSKPIYHSAKVKGEKSHSDLTLTLPSPTFVPLETRERGLARASGLIVFAASGNALGLTPMQDYAAAMAGAFLEHVTTEEKNRAIPAQRNSNWISGFYAHQNLTRAHQYRESIQLSLARIHLRKSLNDHQKRQWFG